MSCVGLWASLENIFIVINDTIYGIIYVINDMFRPNIYSLSKKSMTFKSNILDMNLVNKIIRIRGKFLLDP